LTDIPLRAALTALEKDLRLALANSAVNEVEVEVSLAARLRGDSVCWELAASGAPVAHRVRFVVRSRPGDDPADDEGFVTGSTKISETISILDPEADLPPIIRPRPGIREDDDDD
jgi:hypothetical protein